MRMVSRVMSLRNSAKAFCQLVQSPCRSHSAGDCGGGALAFHWARALHSFVSRESHAPNNFRCRSLWGRGRGRGMVSAPDPTLDEAAAAAGAALALDNRVPATVITGFLGSGKVPLFSFHPPIFSLFSSSFFFWYGKIKKKVKSFWLNFPYLYHLSSLRRAVYVENGIVYNWEFSFWNADYTPESHSHIPTWQADSCHWKWGIHFHLPL